jgi:hypothetical protein
MNVSLFDTKGERGAIKCAVVSFDNHTKQDKFWDENGFTPNGLKILNNTIEHKHRSVYYHDKIVIQTKEPIDLYSLQKGQIQGLDWSIQDGLYTYRFSVWLALELACVQKSYWSNEIKKELTEKYPQVLHNFEKYIVPNALKMNATEKDLYYKAQIPHISLLLKVPFFIKNQLTRHHVGMAINEVSRRYIAKAPEVLPMLGLRKFTYKKNEMSVSFHNLVNQSLFWYNAVSKQIAELPRKNKHRVQEQARAILPQSAITEFIWTGNLWAFANICKERLTPETQEETSQITKKIYDICLAEACKYDIDFAEVINIRGKYL